MNTQTSTLVNGVNVDLMSHETKLQYMAVEDLAQKCAQETDLFFTHHDYDSSYGFELFRRAVRNKDERALEVVITQYQPLVARWVNRWMYKRPDFLLINEEAQDFVAQAFERFWASFTPAKFDKSQNLAAVLRYLQMCVRGAITDAWRKFRRMRLEQELRDEEKEFSQPESTPEDLLQNAEFWQLIKKKSKDPKEYAVVYASFGLALSPREILAEYPGLFRDIKEIYQYKANLLDRLTRDDEIKDFARGR
jgi:DNA-directed RNA polymerase specialized sigma subunit, sigma24 homolog